LETQIFITLFFAAQTKQAGKISLSTSTQQLVASKPTAVFWTQFMMVQLLLAHQYWMEALGYAQMTGKWLPF
jgi:hypothetical protein